MLHLKISLWGHWLNIVLSSYDHWFRFSIQFELKAERLNGFHSLQLNHETQVTLWLQARGPVAYFPCIYVAWFKLLAGERRRQLDRRLKWATATTTDAVFNPTFHLTDVSRQTRRLTWGRGTSSLLEVTGGRSITGEGDLDVGKLERPKHFEKFGAKTFWLFSDFFFPLLLFLIFFPKNMTLLDFLNFRICKTPNLFNLLL